MMKTRNAAGRTGFTILEVLLVLILTGVIVTGVLKALSAQKRFYARQTRILDARHAMRATTTILASELRETSATGGDLYFAASDSVGFRSTVGFGVVCGVSGNTIALRRTSGHFQLAGDDSLLVFVEGTFRDDDDAWDPVAVTAVSTSGLSCASGVGPEQVVQMGSPVAGLWVGAPVRLFRPYVYGLFKTPDGRWWLGRRLRSASVYIPVAGPLAPPADSGLNLSYWDHDDQPAAGLSDIARVQIDVTAPTYRSLTEPEYRSLSTSTFLRNDG